MIELEEFETTGGLNFDDDNFYAGFQAFNNNNFGGINWNQNQDWGEYQVTFPEDATYRLELRAAVPDADNKNIRIYVDGYIIGSASLESTGDWNSYEVQLVSDELEIYAGERTVRIESYGSEWQWNADWVQFTAIGPTTGEGPQSGPTDIPNHDKVVHLSIEGNERVYLAHLPEGYDSGEKRPLVLMFHGANSTANGARANTQLNQISDEYGPVVIYPHSLAAPDGTRYWHGFLGIEPTDFHDVAYVEAIVEQAIDLYNVDENKIFITGNSNGGFFVSSLTCQVPELFAGAAINIAPQLRPEVDACPLTEKMPMIHSMGTIDDTFAYTGDDVRMSAIETSTYYAAHNGCDLTPVETELEDINTADTSTVTKVEYQNCDEGFPVVHYRINDGGHYWPGSAPDSVTPSLNQDINWSELQWQFFQDIIDMQDNAQ
ncbi:carbohydrate-binding protein [Agaribacterium sp. ZY112]|uniref:carbohydrate-binding protein n=1 Tax=Agaribacterium sp. ZY112 TaxID=3233574 RepID=UPI003525C198